MDSVELEKLATTARKGVRKAIEHYVDGRGTETDAARWAWGSVIDQARGGLGSAEAVECARHVCGAGLEEFELVLPLAVQAGLETQLLRREFESVLAGEQMLAEDWFAATGRLRRVRELAQGGRSEDAGREALGLLEDTTSGDDRAEQRIVELLDRLEVDDAIIAGWDILVVRRRRIVAEGGLQITHAVASWTTALRRIATAGGPLAPQADRRLREPVPGLT